MAERGWRWKKRETSDPVQHACRTTVLGLSWFICAANFDVIFFPSHCLKPLDLFIIRVLWSEQHGNNVSRRHTHCDGPLTALRHLFPSFFPSLPLSSCSVFQSSHFFHPFVASFTLSSTLAPTPYFSFYFLFLYYLPFYYWLSLFPTSGV